MNFQQKILCLGNNQPDTNDKVTTLANLAQTTNHGLVSDADYLPHDFGYYHTTVVDLAPGDIAVLAKNFDSIMLLDQEESQWSHPTVFSATYKLIEDLKSTGHDIVIQNPAVLANKEYFNSLMKVNRSFCILPFIQLVSRDNENTVLCSRSLKPVAPLKNLDFKNNKEYQRIRERMIAGEMNHEYCAVCYNLESRGGAHARIFETLEWTTTLGLANTQEVAAFTAPTYYEIRPSNRCNLLCRGCVPRDSHLIDREFKKIGITVNSQNQSYDAYTGFDLVDLATLNRNTRLYVAGGEPTVLPELYEFLRKCIDINKTDFELVINTNAAKISNTLLDLFDHFSALCFTVSIDGVGPVNDYIRHPSKFDQVIANIRTLISRGHRVSFLSVASMYSIVGFGELLEFQDREFPGHPVMLQIDHFPGKIQSPFNHPARELVLASLERCRQTKVYYNYSRGTKSILDNLYDHYKNQSNTTDFLKLQEFFNFNKKLDLSRNQNLNDVLPELAKFNTNFIVPNLIDN